MKYKLSIISLFVLLVIAWNCSHKKSPVESNPPTKEFVTSPQRDIPWPSLAKSPWPMYLHDPQHTGRSPYRGPQEGRVKWMFDTGHDVYSSPALDVDGTIYVGSNSMFLFALNPAGMEKWRFKAEGQTLQTDPLVAADGTIYFSIRNEDGHVYALNQQGKLRWKFQESGMATGDYVISADGRTLYVIMYEPYPRSMGSLYALNTLDGSVRWKFKVASGQGLRWRPAIGPEGTIYCAGNGGLFAIKPDGSAKWEFNTGGSSYYSSSPSVDNAGNIYQQSTFYIHSITPLGEERWRHANMLWDTELSTPTIAYDGTIHAIGICAANSECLLAFDYLGQLKWSVPFSQIKTGLYDTQNSPVIDVEGTVYLGLLTARTSTDTVNFIAIKADGSLKFKMPLRSPDGSLPDIDSTPCIASDGTLYIGSDRPRGKHLYAIK